MSTELRELEYDFCVIGAGPGGWAGAVRGWDLGKKVCVIEERGGLGGTAVWGGALGGKVILQFGKGLRFARPYLKDQTADTTWVWDQMKTRVREALLERAMMLDRQLIALGQTKTFNRPKLKRAQRSGTIERWKGKAKFLSPNTVQVGEETVIRAANFLVCTGSTPKRLTKFPADGKYIITPREIAVLDKLPRSAVVLGCGAVGCEVATLLASIGGDGSNIHLVNSSAAPFGDDDNDVSEYVEFILAEDGVQLHNSAKLEFAKVHEDKGLIECRIMKTLPMIAENTSDGPGIPRQVRKTFWVEQLILCNGRQPNTNGLDLATAGVELDGNGGIMVDEGCRSISAPHIMAAGDVTGRSGTTAIAENEARYAVEVMFSPEVASKPAFESASSVLNLATPIACVGMGEEEARRRQIPHVVAKVDLAHSTFGLIRKFGKVKRVPDEPDGQVVEDMDPREAAYKDLNLEPEPTEPLDEHQQGFVKILVCNDETQRLLGVRVAGDNAESIVQAAAVMIATKQHIRHLARAPGPYHSILEGVQECVRSVLGTSIHKVHVFPESQAYVRPYHPELEGMGVKEHDPVTGQVATEPLERGGRLKVPTWGE